MRHANTKLLLPNGTDYAIALEERHYDSRERGGEIQGDEGGCMHGDRPDGKRDRTQRLAVNPDSAQRIVELVSA